MKSVDIDCPKCSLQIYNAMTDGNTACCSYPTEEFGVPKCGSVYHSCANIVITGSTPAVEYVHEAEHICGGYAPGNAKTWNLVDGSPNPYCSLLIFLRYLASSCLWNW